VCVVRWLTFCSRACRRAVLTRTSAGTSHRHGVQHLVMMQPERRQTGRSAGDFAEDHWHGT
jgi:hypothetical protein